MLQKNYQYVLKIGKIGKRLVIENFKRFTLLKNFAKKKILHRFSKYYAINNRKNFLYKKRQISLQNDLKKNSTTKLFCNKFSNFTILKQRLLELKYYNLKKKVFNKVIKYYFLLKNLIQLKIINKLKTIDFAKLPEKSIPYFERLIYALLIHFIPFCFLSNQTFFPQVVYRENSIILDGVGLQLISKFSLLESFVIFIQNKTSFWASNSFILFGALLSYLRIFAFSYEKFGLPMSVASQGTVGFVYLTLCYSFNLFNTLTPLPFEYFLIVKSAIFRYFLERHFAIKKGWVDELYIKLTQPLVENFSDLIYDLNEAYTFFVAQNVISVLAFLSLCSLIYNIIYYVIKNKDPNIFFVTNAATKILKNREKT